MTAHVNSIINARWVIPVSDKYRDEVLNDHSIVIHHGHIIDILPTADAILKYTADEQLELTDQALIPGLINAHTHACMSLFRGIADDLPLMDWLNNHIWPAEGRWVSEEFVRDGSKLAIAEMIKTGTTCFNDMYFFPEITAQVAAAAGMRATVGMIVIDFPSAWASDHNEYFEKGLKLHDEFKNHPLINTAFAPHAPYSVADEPMQRVQMLAHELEAPIHIHVHETQDEINMSEEQYGKRPLQRLKELGLLSPSLVAVHMTQLQDEEIQQVADNGAHVVHCPQSNLKLASGMCPVNKLIKAGVNVALGTDSAASNNNLDMLSELQTAALLSKGVAGNATALPAIEALKTATINGAKALGIADKTGSLDIGKAADITAINLNKLGSMPVYNAVSQIVYSSQSSDVSHVWINGRQVLKNGHLTTLDEADILSQAADWHQRIVSE